MVRVLAAYILSAGIPLCLRFALGSELSIYIIVGITFIKTTAGCLSLRTAGRLKVCFRLLSPIISVLIAILILVGILITPFSAYRIWLEGVQEHTARGGVSNLFVLLAGFFSSSFSLMLLAGEFFLPLITAAAMLAGLLSVVYQTSLFFAASIVSLLAVLLSFALKFAERKKRLRTIFNYLVLFLLVSLAALPFAAFGKPGGSRMVDETLHPGLRKVLVSLFPRFPLLYGVPGFGTSFNEKRLGGTPVLSGAPVFEVQGRPGQTLYLRTRVYERYDGRAWGSGEDLKQEKPAELSQLFFTDWGQGSEKGIRITLLLDYYFLLPHTLDTQKFIFSAELNELPEGDFDSGFILDPPMRYGDTFLLKTGKQRTPPTLESASPYLQLPDRISAELRELADKMSASKQEPEGTLRNIERFLAANYSYNLKVRGLAPGGEFVESFLFKQREGYCVHFATAFIILARLNGIPARYATGFLTHIPAETSAAEVPGLSAHAWPEVWLEGRGWTVWEATTAVNPAYYQEREGEWLYNYWFDENRLTTRQLRAILGRRPVLQRTGAGGKKRNWAIYLLLCIAALITGLVILILRRHEFRIPLPLREDKRSALRILRKMVAVQQHRRMPAPERIGWVGWTEEVKRSMPRSSLKAYLIVERLKHIVLKAVYSDSALRKRDIRFLIGFYRRFGRKGAKSPS